MFHMMRPWFPMVRVLMALLPWLLLALAVMVLWRLPGLRRSRMRRGLIRRLEEKRGSRVIAMIHRGGGPLRFLAGGGSIGLDEAESMLKIIRQTPPDKPIDLVVHTPGGMILATTQITMALKNHPAPVRVIVPHWAMSGGTLLSVAADEIMMDKNAVLGPIDPQLPRFPGMVAAPSALRVAREKSKDEIDDATWMLIDQAEKHIKQLEDHIAFLLEGRMGPEKARELGRTLTEGRWTHDFPLTAGALRDLGFTVSTDVPDEAYRLLEAFPSGAKFRSVQWLPGKKKKAAAEE